MLHRRFILAAAYVCFLLIAKAPASAADDAAALYIKASKSIVVDCPANSNLDYPGYPPFGPDWDRLAQAAWSQNAEVRRLVHEAASIDHANWPDPNGPSYLNGLRAIANEVSDAALYQHLHGDDAGASQSLQDLLHLTKLIRQPSPPPTAVQHLVAAGIDALAAHSGMIMASDVTLTADKTNAHVLQVVGARRLIESLMDQPDVQDEIAEFKSEVTATAPAKVRAARDRALEAFNRCNVERSFAAMSLACHIYRFEKQRWPQSLDELVPAYLPRIPLDPWGDGKQTLGYTVVKGGLPNGWDRPLLFSRCESQDGLFYRTDTPAYDFTAYMMETPGQPKPIRKRGGQFRDITRWSPDPEDQVGPTTRPLEH